MSSLKLYKHVPLAKASIMQRLFRQRPDENVVIEINNLLASKPLLEIKKNEITSIISQYKINVYDHFTRNLYEFYAVFLNYCLRDRKLDEEEQKNLVHLKDLLDLRDGDINFIHTKLAGAVYREKFEKVVLTGRLDDKDEELLDKLQKNLQLPSTSAAKISEEVRGNFVRTRMDEIMAKQRLSPKEDDEFKTISKSLKVDIKVDKATRQKLDRFKLYWKLENEPLSPIEVFINLQKDELCYFAGKAEWHEDRTSRGEKYWKLIDRSDFFLTNKRIIFSGRVKNTSIKLSKILSFTLEDNGVQLHKDAGKSPLLVFEKDGDLFSVLLPRVMRESDW